MYYLFVCYTRDIFFYRHLFWAQFVKIELELQIPLENANMNHCEQIQTVVLICCIKDTGKSILGLNTLKFNEDKKNRGEKSSGLRAASNIGILTQECLIAFSE